MNITLLSEPNFLSPLNAEVWFNSSAEWATVQNFKYLYKVRQINYNSSTTQDDLGTYRIPPSPTGTSYFSPNKILRTKFTYSPLTSLGGYQISTDYFVKYNTQYGFDSDLVLDYYDELFSGGDVSLTFSYPHNLVSGQVIEVTTNGTINPTYNTTASIASVPNPYAIVTDIPWVNAGPVLGGEVRIVYYDTIFYNSSQGTLGITFSGTHFFNVGDVITIDKYDKSIDIEYDGTASIVARTTNSVALDKEFLGTQSPAGTNGGYISNIKRITGTSSTIYGYNGTRQYNERARDFGLSFSVSSTSISSDGATAAGFLTTYNGWKETPSSQYEVQQMFVRAGSGLVAYQINTFDENLNAITNAQVVFSAGFSGVYSFGVGPQDVLTIFGSSILNGATYYEVFLTDTPSS